MPEYKWKNQGRPLSGVAVTAPRPNVVDSPDDPRYKAYQDSLSAYNYAIKNPVNTKAYSDSLNLFNKYKANLGVALDSGKLLTNLSQPLGTNTTSNFDFDYESSFNLSSKPDHKNNYAAYGFSGVNPNDVIKPISERLVEVQAYHPNDPKYLGSHTIIKGDSTLNVKRVLGGNKRMHFTIPEYKEPVSIPTLPKKPTNPIYLRGSKEAQQVERDWSKETVPTQMQPLNANPLQSGVPTMNLRNTQSMPGLPYGEMQWFGNVAAAWGDNRPALEGKGSLRGENYSMGDLEKMDENERNNLLESTNIPNLLKRYKESSSLWNYKKR